MKAGPYDGIAPYATAEKVDAGTLASHSRGINVNPVYLRQDP
jgi:hypothetical protein